MLCRKCSRTAIFQLPPAAEKEYPSDPRPHDWLQARGTSAGERRASVLPHGSSGYTAVRTTARLPYFPSYFFRLVVRMRRHVGTAQQLAGAALTDSRLQQRLQPTLPGPTPCRERTLGPPEKMPEPPARCPRPPSSGHSLLPLLSDSFPKCTWNCRRNHTRCSPHLSETSSKALKRIPPAASSRQARHCHPSCSSRPLSAANASSPCPFIALACGAAATLRVGTS